MEIIAVILGLISALGAYQFFIWLYKKKFTPNILIGILPHYEILNGETLNNYGHYCIANEFVFNTKYFAKTYDINKPKFLTKLNNGNEFIRTIYRNKDGNCSLPIIIQNLGKGFSKELFYVISFYENELSAIKKSNGKIKVNELIMERLDKSYLYSSNSNQDNTDENLIMSDKSICKIYDDIGLLADYVYFESFLEPMAFVTNIININVSTDISEFVILFNVFSLQNEKLMISKYQKCIIQDEFIDNNNKELDVKKNTN